jgi:hypothetical protein
MKAQFNGQYRNKKGNLTFRFIVTGTEEELAQYKELQGQYYVENDNGEPLYLTTTYVSDSVELKVSSKGTIYADTSEVDKIVSFAKSQGIDLSKGLTDKLMSALGGKTQVAEPQQVKGEGLDKM